MEQSIEKPIYETVGLSGRLLMTFVVMTGTFMAILDTTIVDVVVPKMMAPLKTDLYGVQWVITSYMASAATALLLVESLDKVFGLKKLFVIGITIFTTASYLCGVATDLSQMIFFRCLQGSGEAFVVASAQSILFSLYPPHLKGLAMGIYGMGVSFAPALGPTLGGWLTENLGWRWVFFVNLPIGAMTMIIGALVLPNYKTIPQRFRFNFISYALLASFTISLLIMLSKGEQKGWFQSNHIIILFIISILSILAYAVSELVFKNKLIDFSIFKIPQYRYASLIYFFTLGLSIYQLFFLIPLYYENLKNYTTFQTGLHMLGFAIFIGLTSPLAGFLCDKIGEKYVLIFNAFLYITTSIFLVPNLNYYTPSVKTILLTIPLGFSLGSFFAPVTTLAMRHLKEKTSLGVGLMHYLRFMGGSFGTAIATNTLQSKISLHFEEIGNIQNTPYLYNYIQNFKEQFSGLIAEELLEIKGGLLIAKAQTVMAMSDAFREVFRHAGYFGIFGLSFLTFVFIHDIKGKRAKIGK